MYQIAAQVLRDGWSKSVVVVVTFRVAQVGDTRGGVAAAKGSGGPAGGSAGATIDN